MKRRRGFALVAALWLLVAISALSLELSVMARGRRLTAANVLESSHASAAATSAIEHARGRLTRALTEGGTGSTWNDPRSIIDPWHDLDLGLPDSISLERNVWYSVRVRPLGGMINVNRSSEDDLRRYFQGLELDAVRVEDLVDGIMDWRDADDHRRNRGAEVADYQKAGAREIPSNAPFLSIDELRFVKAMSPELLARVRGDLTTYGSGQINVNTAPRQVLLALPGITPSAAEVILSAQRSGLRIRSVQQLRDLLPSIPRSVLERSLPFLLPKITFDTHEVIVTGEGWQTGSPVRVRETAIVARGADAAFVVWRQRQ